MKKKEIADRLDSIIKYTDPNNPEGMGKRNAILKEYTEDLKPALGFVRMANRWMLLVGAFTIAASLITGYWAPKFFQLINQ